MDQHELQEAVKGDLETIPKLKIGVISAKDLYGSLLIMAVMISFAILFINIGSQLLLHALHCYPAISMNWVARTWCYGFVGSCFLSLMLRRFILFARFVKGRLKTELFIKKKCLHFALIYLFIYALAYLFFAYMFDISKYATTENLSEFGKDWIVFDLIQAQIMALGVAFFANIFLVCMEIERLGIGIVFNIVSEFVLHINHKLNPQNNEERQ